MDKSILICVADQNMEDLVRLTLEDDLPEHLGSITTVLRKTVEGVEKQLKKKKFDLIISDYRYSAAETDQDISKGLGLINMLEKKEHQTPKILITHILTPRLNNTLGRLPMCTPLTLENEADHSGFITALIEISTLQLKREEYKSPVPGLTSPRSDSARGIVDIRLNMEKQFGEYTIKERTPGTESIIGKDTLKVDFDTFYDLIDESLDIELIQKHEALKITWEKRFQKIGKKIYKELFLNNPHFLSDYSVLKGRIKNNKNIKFRFAIQEKLHPVHIESLFEDLKKQDAKYLMLKSPIYRQLPLPTGSYAIPTFDRKDRSEPVNCLLIKSNYSGSVTLESGDTGRKIKETVTFDELENISQEIETIYRILDENRQTFHIDTIRVIDTKSSQNSSAGLGAAPVETGDWIRVEDEDFYEVARQTLDSRSWQMVHYAGHSYYSEKLNTGFFILPGKYGKAVDTQTIAKAVREAKIQFLFLSSCHSLEKEIAFQLAQKAAPSILGFRWNLADKHGAEYAARFYTYLVKERASLESAFLKTQQDMYTRHTRDPIWASPMLVMQCDSANP